MLSDDAIFLIYVGLFIITVISFVSIIVSKESAKLVEYRREKEKNEKAAIELEKKLQLEKEAEKALEKKILEIAKPIWSHVPLNHRTFVSSHNAFSSYAYNYLINAQQTWSLTEQMDAGVRSLMLDIHAFKDKVHLCHVQNPGCEDSDGKLKSEMRFQRPFDPSGEDVTIRLQEIKDWLDKQPNDQEAAESLTPPILIILLEDRISDNPELLKYFENAIEKTGLASYVLKAEPSEWNPFEQGGWPSPAWMLRNKKQVIFFSSKAQTKYAYKTDWYLYETNYGQIKSDKVCIRETPVSLAKNQGTPYYFYLLNYFPSLTSSIIAKAASNFTDVTYDRGIWPDMNTTWLKNTLDYCFNNGHNGYAFGRYPNFIGLDNVDQPGSMDIVNALNTSSMIELGKRVMENPTIIKDKFKDDYSSEIDPRFKDGGELVVPGFQTIRM